MRELERDILALSGSLARFADYHEVFGLHAGENHWVFREWAPFAEKIWIIGEDTHWEPGPAFELERVTPDGVFEKKFPLDAFWHGKLYRLKIKWPGGAGDRIPSAARYVVQDPDTLIFNARVWYPPDPYQPAHDGFRPENDSLLIYETHVGMALEDGRIGTFKEFEQHILPKIAHSGYTAIQLMAVAEHPYYASFGYHVSSFFAPSSRFGTPDDLKSLVDSAHRQGIRVLMDIIHSHAVNNEVEGLSRFDGSLTQFFHGRPHGFHPLWDSRCFDYSKPMVRKFLLSNLRYWLEEFNVDGFRFDGITSMLFWDRGAGRAFTSYADYYGDDVDEDALSYLYLANKLVHEISGYAAVTIAEDVSGYPGLAAPASEKGIGFDFRFSMGLADFWIRLLKEHNDEDWPMGTLWHELTTRRAEERTVSYAECHDQALVGDQTLLMRLMGQKIYSDMSRERPGVETVRAVALHKMIRLITLACAGSGYLNFMGNEFGHPEWIDFPTQRNHWSFHHARRQWSLKYDDRLYFSSLFEFDRRMIEMARQHGLLDGSRPDLLHIHEQDKIIAFQRKELLFVFNFHPTRSFEDYRFRSFPGKYRMILDTDQAEFGGLQRLVPDQVHFTLFFERQDKEKEDRKENWISLYLPNRTALVLGRCDP